MRSGGLRGGRVESQRGAGSAGDYGRHPSPAYRQLAAPDRVNATVFDVEAAGVDASLDCGTRVPEPDQLPVRDRAVLAIRERSDGLVTWTLLIPHSAVKSVHPIPPPRPVRHADQAYTQSLPCG